MNRIYRDYDTLRVKFVKGRKPGPWAGYVVIDGREYPAVINGEGMIVYHDAVWVEIPEEFLPRKKKRTARKKEGE